ncbi:MAG: hypothetical protein ACJ72W_01525 [Actinoallomurus sp.]
MLAITSITAAKPAVVTGTAALPTGLAAGALVSFEGTGATDLDGTAWRITNINVATKTFTLVDSDRAGKTAVGAKGTYQAFDDTSNLISACLANITVSGQAPDSINMDDMCGTATVLGDPKPPSFTYQGFVDNESAGFKNLVRASLESPKSPRVLLIDYGDAVGYIFGPAEIGEMTVTAAVGGGLQFSGSGIFTEVPTYSWALGPEPVAA